MERCDFFFSSGRNGEWRNVISQKEEEEEEEEEKKKKKKKKKIFFCTLGPTHD